MTETSQSRVGQQTTIVLVQHVAFKLPFALNTDEFFGPADYRRSGGDAAEREGAGRSQEEAGHDQAAAVQVPAL